MKISNKFNNILLNILFIILVFQQALIINSKGILNYFFSYFHDALTFFLLLIFLVYMIKGKKILKYEFMILICFLLFIIIGVISNFHSNVQPIGYALSDIFICSRFIIGYFGVVAICRNKISKTFLFDHFNNTCKITSVILFILTVHEYTFPPFFKQVDFRYFAYSNILFFPHPTYLAAACIILICVLVVSINYDKHNIYYIILLCIVSILTFRIKAIGFVLVLFLLYFIIILLDKKFKVIFYVLSLVSVMYIGINQLQAYFFTNNFSPRLIMLKDSIKLAIGNFPLGIGFATFGSHISVIHYSSIYYKLGYDVLDGMGPLTAAYLNDTFWPIIIAQMGFLGLVIFIILLIYFIKIIFRVKDKNKYCFIGLLSIISYMILASSAETSFFNPVALIYFMIFATIIVNNEN